MLKNDGFSFHIHSFTKPSPHTYPSQPRAGNSGVSYKDERGETFSPKGSRETSKPTTRVQRNLWGEAHARWRGLWKAGERCVLTSCMCGLFHPKIPAQCTFPKEAAGKVPEICTRKAASTLFPAVGKSRAQRRRQWESKDTSIQGWNARSTGTRPPTGTEGQLPVHRAVLTQMPPGITF